MLYWRQAGLNYIKFSNVAAKTLRKCVNQDLKKEAAKREEGFAKVSQWANGKIVKAEVAK